MEAFKDLFERARREVNGSKREQDVAQEGEIGERAWVAGPGAVLAQRLSRRQWLRISTPAQ